MKGSAAVMCFDALGQPTSVPRRLCSTCAADNPSAAWSSFAWVRSSSFTEASSANTAGARRRRPRKQSTFSDRRIYNAESALSPLFYKREIRRWKLSNRSRVPKTPTCALAPGEVYQPMVPAEQAPRSHLAGDLWVSSLLHLHRTSAYSFSRSARCGSRHSISILAIDWPACIDAARRCSRIDHHQHRRRPPAPSSPAAIFNCRALLVET